MRPQHHLVSHRAAVVLSVLSVLLVLLTGCSGADPYDGSPAGAGTSDSGTTGGAATADDRPATGPAGDPAPVTTPAGDSATAADDAEETAGSGTDLAVSTAADEGFTLQIPTGWSDVTGTVAQDIEVALRADTMTDDFFTNVVVASEEPIDDLGGSVEGAAKEIAGEEGSYRMLPPVQVAGETAHGYVVTRTNEGVAVVQTQRWIEHADRLYVVTLSSAQAQQGNAEALFEQILGGWEWTDD